MENFIFHRSIYSYLMENVRRKEIFFHRKGKNVWKSKFDLTIPKDIVDLLDLKDKDYVHVSIEKIKKP